MKVSDVVKVIRNRMKDGSVEYIASLKNDECATATITVSKKAFDDNPGEEKEIEIIIVKDLVTKLLRDALKDQERNARNEFNF